MLNQIKAFTFALALTLCVAGCAQVSEVPILIQPLPKPGALAVSTHPAHWWNESLRFVIFRNEKGEYTLVPFIDSGGSIATTITDGLPMALGVL